jgi:hypothetical protein
MTVISDLAAEKKEAEELKNAINEAVKPCLTREHVILVIADIIEAVKTDITTDDMANKMVLYAKSGELSITER